MFNISKQSDYGLLIISYLKNKSSFVSVSEILKELKIPKRFLAKIAFLLVKNKLLESKEGINGGYRLSKSARKISFYDYLKIFEGDLKIVSCFSSGDYCINCQKCHHKRYLQNYLSKKIIRILKKDKLLKII